ncbi:MAG: DUF479 domain-containing protein [Bacteroidetes bacterium]|nr:DUF479 domain-containing protein [Bacteroidota bacterium]
MNFLAHLQLSCHDDHLLIGNFLGDFLKPKEVKELPVHIREGVDLHRAIDSFTDTHPVVSEAKKVLYPHFGKYASVFLDIFFDYLLARNWELYSAEAMNDFIYRCYNILRQRMDWIPERLHPRFNNMIKGKFLHEYTNWDGLSNTFDRMRRYVSHPEYFANPIPPLKEQEEFLNEKFLLFYPDLQKRAADFCAC